MFCLFVVIVCDFLFVCLIHIFSNSFVLATFTSLAHMSREYAGEKKRTSTGILSDESKFTSLIHILSEYLFIFCYFFARSKISESRLAGPSKNAEKMACLRFEKPAATAFEQCFNIMWRPMRCACIYTVLHLQCK